MKTHYSQKYYAWQKKAGEYGGTQDLWKFQSYIKKTDTVLDFGCGGGYILSGIQCKKKYGVEINHTAAQVAKEKNITIYTCVTDIPKNLKFDVIISHHALEHLENPVTHLKSLFKHLKKNGLAIHVVPVNDWRVDKKYNPKDINKHLYTWTPLLIGNLFVHCGYKIKDIQLYPYQWLPLSRYYYRYIPKLIYYVLTRLWGGIVSNREIRIIAKKD